MNKLNELVEQAKVLKIPDFHSIKLDKEFQTLIPELTKEEMAGLEESIKTQGCLDPLTCWGDILIDGHNRYKICKKIGILPEIKSIFFSNRELAKEWIILYHINRRNLNSLQRIELAEKRRDILEKLAKEKMLAGKKDPCPPAGKGSKEYTRTSYQIGKLAGVGHTTIESLNYLKREAPEVLEKIRKGESSINSEYHKIRQIKIAGKESNIQRLNKIRELAAKGARAEQIAEAIGHSVDYTRLLARRNAISLHDEILNYTRKPEVNRMVDQTISIVSSACSGMELIYNRLDKLDASKIDYWIESLSESLSVLNKLLKTLKKRKNL